MNQEQEYQDLVKKFKEKLKEELGQEIKVTPRIISKEYREFKEEIFPGHFTFYEKLCNFSEKAFKLKVTGKTAQLLENSIKTCHLNITPSGVYGSAFIISLLIFIFGSLLFYAIFQKGFFVLLTAFLSLVLFYVFVKLPDFLANTWRMKASNQMIQCVFYLVTYMKHTSNLERAIEFASEHIGPPLSLDLKKILWQLETGEYESLKEALNAYLDFWKESNAEFVEAMHLIESSLYEPSEEARLALLDKSLDVILSETYEKMLHYAHNLQSPITTLHMLGIIMPILGMVILPLVASFLSSPETPPTVIAMYIAFIYNLMLPIGVYYLGKMILTKRPSGYGDTDISEANPELKKFKKVRVNLGKVEILINPFLIAGFVFLILLFIGLAPLTLNLIDPQIAKDLKVAEYYCLDKSLTCPEEDKTGPYGLAAGLFSLLITLAFGLGIGLFFLLTSQNVIKIRENTKKLEDEFASSLFQLGNRLGDGLPAEIAVVKVAQTMEGTTSGNFFSLVHKNISRLGLGLKEAIFHPKHGALLYFPSKVIESSMKVLIESAKKGPRIAAQALFSMSRYIKEIHRVNERLKDLMAEVVSSMNSQIKFLTPVIAGIVVGITSMITTVLIKLSQQMSETLVGMGEEATGMIGTGMLGMFGLGMPTFYFQIIVGIYVVEITYILTILSNGIENGADKLGEKYLLGKNLVRSIFFYCLVSAFVIILFTRLSEVFLGKFVVGG